MKIFVFGNSMVDMDSLPFRILPGLRKKFPEIEFIELDPNEGLENMEKEANIIDTVVGIERVILIEDIDSIENSPKVSMHDFDLGFNLKLLKKMGRLKKVRIIGVPAEMDEEKAMNQVSEKIKAILLSKNV